jgi:hypothetical protein
MAKRGFVSNLRFSGFNHVKISLRQKCNELTDDWLKLFSVFLEILEKVNELLTKNLALDK